MYEGIIYYHFDYRDHYLRLYQKVYDTKGKEFKPSLVAELYRPQIKARSLKSVKTKSREIQELVLDVVQNDWGLSVKGCKDFSIKVAKNGATCVNNTQELYWETEHIYNMGNFMNIKGFVQYMRFVDKFKRNIQRITYKGYNESLKANVFKIRLKNGKIFENKVFFAEPKAKENGLQFKFRSTMPVDLMNLYKNVTKSFQAVKLEYALQYPVDILNSENHATIYSAICPPYIDDTNLAIYMTVEDIMKWNDEFLRVALEGWYRGAQKDHKNGYAEDKRFYYITTSEGLYVYTNIFRMDKTDIGFGLNAGMWGGNSVWPDGSVGDFVHRIGQEEIKKAIISDTPMPLK